MTSGGGNTELGNVVGNTSEPSLGYTNIKSMPSCDRESKSPKCESSDYFGPALPPNLAKDVLNHKANEVISDNSKLGKHLGISETEDFPGSNVYGPSLPTGKSDIIGPAIPAHLLPTVSSDASEETDSAIDEECGPSILLMSDSQSSTNSHACNKFRTIKPTDQDIKINKRESWMLELPPDKVISGTFARQFRKKVLSEKDSDRSLWTDIPGTTKKKCDRSEEDKRSIAEKRIEEKNREMERLIKKAKKKKREKSLLEVHLKKMKKKAKKEEKQRQKEGKPVERRPFDRNIDLQVNRFDESLKNTAIKKAQLLNDRFASGQSKFL